MPYAFDKLEFARCSDPQAILDNTSPTTRCVDTIGCSAVTLVVYLGATDIAMAALSVSESDTLTDANSLSTGAAISGATFAGSLPSATDDNKFYAIKIPITGARKRYFDATITAGDGSAGSFITSFWIKEPLLVPNTAAGQGLGGIVAIAG